MKYYGAIEIINQHYTVTADQKDVHMVLLKRKESGKQAGKKGCLKT